ncbi:PREDICTED: probable splicing factor 3A subunit 1 [Camelina sativa]|uniref:Probable splicing factor 3A subunit 1 n=1 Tax=Camelina sativa TaxID=90675 RepID=A0ABM1QRN2_CAMSA|nr:PREDICTED: probable splicing factor 3A subunit 1 [Camelina sativa]
MVLICSKKLKKGDACRKTVLDDFFTLLQLRRLEEGVEAAVIDLHAFVVGVDCFSHMGVSDYSETMLPPLLPSEMISQLTHMQHRLRIPVSAQSQGDVPRRMYSFPYAYKGRMTLKQVGIMKFTALYVARYGVRICPGLMKEVVTKPEFEFMEPTSRNFSLYNAAVDAYSRVLEPYDDVFSVSDFLDRLELEKLNEDGEANINMHAFVSGVDYFAAEEDAEYSALMPPSEPISSIMNRVPPLRCGRSRRMMQTPRPEEREAKRRKHVYRY